MSHIEFYDYETGEGGVERDLVAVWRDGEWTEVHDEGRVEWIEEYVEDMGWDLDEDALTVNKHIAPPGNPFSVLLEE